MFNSSQKKKFFTFFAVLIITVFAAFFAWDAMFSVGGEFVNKILDYTNKIGARIFTASILQEGGQFADLISVSEEVSVENEVETEPESVQESSVVEEKSTQDLLDDIQEKLDIIKQQVAELIEEQNSGLQQEDEEEASEEEIEELEEPEEAEQNLESESAVEDNTCFGGININTDSEQDLDRITNVGPVTAQKIIDARPFYSLNDLLKVSGIGEKTLQKIKDQGCAYVEPGLAPPIFSGGGGGGEPPPPPVYKKLLISEIQISPINQRFIELYNPNPTDISLTGWYLQRKTATSDSWGSGVTSTKFAGKSVSAGGYFLISRSDENADVFLNDLTITEDNSFALKNPSGEISDKLGFGLALDFELLAVTSPSSGQSIGRKFNEESQDYKDTDNNLIDFELDLPTPGSQNIKWTEPVLPSLISIEITTLPEKLAYFVGEELDIFGLGVVGLFSDGASQALAITLDNISGFDNTTPSDAQILTISYEEKTATFKISILSAPEPIDAVPPIGTIIINERAAYTNSRNVELTLFAEDDLSEVVEMRIANGSSYRDWEPYAVLRNWELPATNGVKTVRVKFRDTAGNENTPGIPATIVLDTIAPIITLNGESVAHIFIGEEYQELGVIVEDANIGDDALVIGGDIVDTSAVGAFNITYDVADLAGNSAVQVIRTVVVNNIVE